jgi:chemotaxis protein CheD
MSKIIKVGMADYKVAGYPDILTTLGLGSCVGIAIYDKIHRIAGLAHIMLPTSENVRSNLNVAKYADTAIPSIINEMISKGANKASLVVKLAGGAQMFGLFTQNDFMKIGLRNVEYTKEVLSNMGIKIIAEDTGGNSGRTIEFMSEDGSLLIKTVGKPQKVI